MSKYEPNRWSRNNRFTQPLGACGALKVSMAEAKEFVNRKRAFAAANVHAQWQQAKVIEEYTGIRVVKEDNCVTGFTTDRIYTVRMYRSHRILFAYDEHGDAWFTNSEATLPEERRPTDRLRPQAGITELDDVTINMVARYGFNTIAKIRMQGGIVNWRKHLRYVTSLASWDDWRKAEFLYQGTVTGRLRSK